MYLCCCAVLSSYLVLGPAFLPCRQNRVGSDGQHSNRARPAKSDMHIEYESSGHVRQPVGHGKAGEVGCSGENGQLGWLGVVQWGVIVVLLEEILVPRAVGCRSGY